MDKNRMSEIMRIDDEKCMRNAQVFFIDKLNPRELGVFYVLCNKLYTAERDTIYLSFKTLRRLLHLEGLGNSDLMDEIVKLSFKLRSISVKGESESSKMSFSLFGTTTVQDDLMIVDATLKFQSMIKDLKIELIDEELEEQLNEEELDEDTYED